MIHKDKLVGVVLSLFSIISLIIVFSALMFDFSFASIFLFIITIAICFSTLNIGIKLIFRESEQPIPIDVIKQRVNKYIKKNKKIASPMLIYICGIDGSGKTTQIKYLIYQLKKKGIKYKFVWLRWAAFLSYPFLAFCRITGYITWKRNNKNIRYPEHYYYKNKALSRVWTYLFTCDMLIYSFIRVKIPIMRNNIVVSDRYIFDAIVDLMTDTKNNRLLKSNITKIFLSFLPENYLSIMLDLNEENAYARKKDIPSMEYLRERRRGYLDLAHELKIPVLNANESSGKIHSIITNQFLIHYPFWYKE